MVKLGMCSIHKLHKVQGDCPPTVEVTPQTIFYSQRRGGEKRSGVG